MKVLLIERPVFVGMVEACQAAFPREACGFLGGRGSVATSLYPVDNVAALPTEQFLMDPRRQIEAMAAMERRGEEMVAIYHSHPQTSAAPSRADIAEAHYPQVSCIIVGLAGPKPVVKAFRLDPKFGRAVEGRFQVVNPRGTTH